MSLELMNLNNTLMKKHAIKEVLKCNDVTRKYGIELTSEDAIELVKTRFSALKENGRIELGGGVIDKIILEFCDSPYISMNNYTDTLHELIEIFYYYKNQVLDLVSDDELIKFMGKSFNGSCKGSLELLADRELAKASDNILHNLPMEYVEEGEDDE